MNKLSRFVLLSLIISIASIIHSQPASTADNTSDIIEFTLDNGLQVVLKPMHRTPLVSSFLFYKVGSSYESEEYYGACHFLEHLMFKGTDKYKKGEIDKVTQMNGGENNACAIARSMRRNSMQNVKSSSRS